MSPETIYRRLLALLPEDLRKAFGDDMIRLFTARLSEAGGSVARAWVWLRAAVDLVESALLERVRTLLPHGSARAPLAALPRDIGYAIRGLVRSPGLAVISVVTLSLGIGASTVAFTLVNGILVRPLPFSDPDRLVVLSERRPDGRELTLSFPNFDDWRSQSRALEGIAAIRFAADATVLGGGEPTRGTILPVSREFFRLLGVQPFLGRPILPEENRQGARAVAVLSYEFWASTFGSRPELDALDVKISGTPFAVVGVMPPGFKVLEEGDVYIALERDPFRVRSSHNYRAVGRLAPAVTLAQAQEELNGIATRILEAYPDETQTVEVGMRPLRDEILGEVDRPLLLLLGAAGLLLLLACSNVASALLARGTLRAGEMAIRTALGAARARLVQQLVTESLILAAFAGALALGLTQLALSLIRSQGTDLLPRLQTVSMDPTAVLFALAASLVTVLAFGLLPALRVSQAAAGTLLPGRGGGTPGTRRTAWHLLVGGEAALAAVLVVACGLLLRSLQEVLSVDTHFRADGVLTVAMDLSEFTSSQDRTAILEELKREYEALPGVTTVGFVSHLPTEATRMTGPVVPSPIPDDLSFDNAPPSSGWRVVDEDYFTAMGIPLLRGRVFSGEDGPDAPAVIILNEALARQAFPGKDPIGRPVRFLPFWADVDQTVVGVVAEARDWRREPGNQPEGFVYWPQRVGYTRYLTAVLRTGGDPAALAAPARERLRATAPTVPGTFQTMRARLGESLRERSFTLSVLGTFTALSLLLAAVGIYGTVSYSVSRRRREIGIQLALGAATGGVRRRIFLTSLAVVALGVAAGLACAFVLGGVMEGLLYGVSSQDPATYAAAPLVLLGAAALAIAVPVIRYTRLDPALTMRAE